jgi:hypothetical protein
MREADGSQSLTNKERKFIMYPSNFDTLTDIAKDLSGEILEVEVYDADMDPNYVLQDNLEWNVRIKWQVSGLCAPGLGGDWHIRVILESMGAGFEGIVKEQAEPVSSAAPAATRTYDVTIKLPKPEDVPLTDGTYKLVLVINHTNTGAGITKRTRMAGFYEGPLLEFVDAEV